MNPPKELINKARMIRAYRWGSIGLFVASVLNSVSFHLDGGVTVYPYKIPSSFLMGLGSIALYVISDFAKEKYEKDVNACENARKYPKLDDFV